MKKFLFRKSDLANILSPHKLFLITLENIDFDESLVLDWLTSEKSGLLMLVYCCKLLRNSWSEFSTECQNLVSRPTPKRERTSRPCNQKNRESPVLTVREDLAGPFPPKTIHLCDLMVEDTISTDAGDFAIEIPIPEKTGRDRIERTIQFCGRLRAKLEKLHDALLLGFNPASLIKLLLAIETRE